MPQYLVRIRTIRKRRHGSNRPFSDILHAVGESFPAFACYPHGVISAGCFTHFMQECLDRFIIDFKPQITQNASP